MKLSQTHNKFIKNNHNSITLSILIGLMLNFTISNTVYATSYENNSATVKNSTTLNANSKQEIDYLINYLANSNCSFQRNGSWYTSKQASMHIQKKYEYLINKGWINSAEIFIERAASQSSFSGKPYQVACMGVVKTSKSWLKLELDNYRKLKTKK